MARLCERPGCSQAAEVAYGIDAEHLLVWLDPFDGAVGYRAGVLCRRHADAMVVPLGWMLDDRREAVPRLFKTREEPVAAPREKRRRSRGPGDETGSIVLDVPLPLDDEPVAATPADDDVVTPAPEASGASTPVSEAGQDVAPDVTPWEPSFDTSTDAAGLGGARSPLLSRAFGRRNGPHRESPDGENPDRETEDGEN